LFCENFHRCGTQTGGLFYSTQYRFLNRAPTWISALAARFSCRTFKTRGALTKHLTVGAGKDAVIYVADRDNMGKFNSNSDQIYQEISGQLGGQVFSYARLFQWRG